MSSVELLGLLLEPTISTSPGRQASAGRMGGLAALGAKLKGWAGAECRLPRKLEEHGETG